MAEEVPVFDSNRKSTGTDYTATFALLAMALIFSPVALIMTGGYVSFSTAATISIVCLALAWFRWKNHSQLSISTIGTSPKRK